MASKNLFSWGAQSCLHRYSIINFGNTQYCQFQWVRKLDRDFLVLLRGELQLSASELVPIEQFRLGGAGTVKGYRQDLALGDNGVFFGAETRIPILRFQRINEVLQLAPFVDLGAIWNSNDTQISNDFLAAVGIGLNFKAGNGFEARLDWGIPLVDVDFQGILSKKMG